MSCFKSEIAYGSYQPTPEVLALLGQVRIENRKLTHQEECKTSDVPFVEPNKKLMTDFMKCEFPIGRIYLSEVARYSEQFAAANGLPGLVIGDDSALYYKGAKLMTIPSHLKGIKEVAELDKAELFYSGLSNCIILRLDDEGKLVFRINLDHAAFTLLSDGNLLVQPFYERLRSMSAFVVFLNPEVVSKLEIIGYMTLMRGVLPKVPTFVQSICIIGDIAAEGFSKEMLAIPFIGAFKLYLSEEARLQLKIKGNYITDIHVFGERPRCRMILGEKDKPCPCLNQKHKNIKGKAEVEVLARIVVSCIINGENMSVDEETIRRLISDEQSMELARVARVVLLGDWRGIGPVDPMKKDDPEEFGKVDLDKIPGYRNIRNLPLIQGGTVPISGDAVDGRGKLVETDSSGSVGVGTKVAPTGTDTTGGVGAVVAKKKEVPAGLGGSDAKTGRTKLSGGGAMARVSEWHGQKAVGSSASGGCIFGEWQEECYSKAIKSRFPSIDPHVGKPSDQPLSVRPFHGGVWPGGVTPDMVEAAKKAAKEEKKTPGRFDFGKSIAGNWQAFNLNIGGVL